MQAYFQFLFASYTRCNWYYFKIHPTPIHIQTKTQTKIFALFFSLFSFFREEAHWRNERIRGRRGVCVCVCVLREIESRPGLNWGMESRAVQQRQQGQGGALRRCTLSRSIALATILSLSLNEQCRHDWRIQTSRRRSGRLVSRNNNYTMDLRTWDIRCQTGPGSWVLALVSISYWYYDFFFFFFKESRAFNSFPFLFLIRTLSTLSKNSWFASQTKIKLFSFFKLFYVLHV